MPKRKRTQDAYAAAGVNIDAGNKAVRRMRAHIRSARTKGMLTDIGLFGGLFQVPKGYRTPVLVSSTDGVGTKLMLASALDKYETVGQDLVNHCVNDIIVQGAKPLFFMDYYATGKLHPKIAERIVMGLAQACCENGCALLGGETAEMPGMYRGKDFDLAGTIVGIVEKKRIIDGKGIAPGDIIIGLPSTGLHTNGYSLARKIFLEKMKSNLRKQIPELGASLGDALLAVHRSYWPVISPLLEQYRIKGMAHITGGGLLENIPRILPATCQAHVHQGSWPIPALFKLLAVQGGLDERTMFRALNMGVGMVLITSKAAGKAIILNLRKRKESVYVIGEIKRGTRRVVFA
jgi:phosphoribosylformylglycinamidine cyclo-ligase